MKASMWLARTELGELFLFPRRPVRINTKFLGQIWSCGSSQTIELSSTEFPDITFSNSPVIAEIEISGVNPEPVNTLQLEINH